jgi:hypothetical protein
VFLIIWVLEPKLAIYEEYRATAKTKIFRRPTHPDLLPARVGEEISPISGSPVLRIAQVYISDVQINQQK